MLYIHLSFLREDNYMNYLNEGKNYTIIDAGESMMLAIIYNRNLSMLLAGCLQI